MIIEENGYKLVVLWSDHKSDFAVSILQRRYAEPLMEAGTACKKGGPCPLSYFNLKCF